MEDQLIENQGACLNCGTKVQANFCSNCGQKFQPTKLPLKLFLEDAVETLFNIDNRVFRTLKDLFGKPGKVTREYLEGRRASYLPPLRIYLSISIIYFLLARTIDSSKIFFINFGNDTLSSIGVGEIIEYILFFMVPVMALIVQFFHIKRKGFYVEYLIFSMHLHSIWFVLLSFQLIAIYLADFVEHSYSSVPYLLLLLTDTLSQLLPFVYLMLFLKRVFDQGWVKAFAKAFGIMVFYLMLLGGVVIIFLKLNK